MYQYLVYRMKVKGISNEMIYTALGVTEKTLWNKIQGITPFTWEEVKKIKQDFFPEESIEELFKLESA